MTTIDVVRGDITKVAVDAIVNAANNRMRGGGGGVNAAVHSTGGPMILADCIARFPHGLATGDAGWTTAGNLPCRWVIHTVGPDHNADQRDRDLLTSCYRRSLEVAAELGARTIAFPLISAGVFGWPRRDAVAAAIETLAAGPETVERARLVAFDDTTYEAMQASLIRWIPMRILGGIQILHGRGYHTARVLPGMNSSGTSWRVAVAAAKYFDAGDGFLHGRASDRALKYTTGDPSRFAGIKVDVTTTADDFADAIIRRRRLAAAYDEPAYAAWYATLMSCVEENHDLPVAYADYFDRELGWEIGWGSGIRYPVPPPPPAT